MEYEYSLPRGCVEWNSFPNRPLWERDQGLLGKVIFKMSSKEQPLEGSFDPSVPIFGVFATLQMQRL